MNWKKNLTGEIQWEGSNGRTMFPVEQGDILSVEKIKKPVLVVSKNFFNETEQVIACPIASGLPPAALHIPVAAEEVQGVVLCEQMKLLDLQYRGFKKISQVKYLDLINITDAIQSIFDY